MSVLHTLSDGSIVRRMGSRELIAIPVWKGNRVIDMMHVQNLQAAIGLNVKTLDFGYRIVTYNTTDAAGRVIQESAIVDGQHRARVLSEYYASCPSDVDFPVVVLEKRVESEYDVISYFNAINNSKPIKYTDSNLVVNKYIQELEKVFNVKKQLAIRPKATCRPYLSADKLREQFTKYANHLSDSSIAAEQFATRVKEWNQTQLLAVTATDPEIVQKAAKAEFMLAVDSRLRWIPELLHI
jgi:hypothetical protein